MSLKSNYKEDILDITKNTARKYNLVNNADGTVSLEDVTEYTQVGDNFGAQDINDTNIAVNKVFNLLTGTITAGGTSLTITDASITTDSIIDIYFKDKLLAPTSVVIESGSITIEISEEETDTIIGVRVL